MTNDSKIPGITCDMFEAYERVRVSGETNMFNVPIVCRLSGLSPDEVKTIMKSYRSLCNTYPHVRELLS